MALGPYDALTTFMLQQTEAEAVVVIVLGGNRGSGFSVQALAPHPEHPEQAYTKLHARIPQLLRDIAEQIEQSHHEARN